MSEQILKKMLRVAEKEIEIKNFSIMIETAEMCLRGIRSRGEEWLEAVCTFLSHQKKREETLLQILKDGIEKAKQ